VKVNTVPAALDTEIKEGDCVSVCPAFDGADASAKIKDVVLFDKKIVFNGEEIALPLRVFANGKEVDPETAIADRAEITTGEVASLASLLIHLGYDLNSFFERNVSLNVDGERVGRLIKNYRLTVNGAEVSLFSEEQTVRPGDRLEFSSADALLRISDFASLPREGNNLRIKINGEEYVFPGGHGRIVVNGEKAAMDTVIKEGDSISTQDGKDAEAVLVDIFRYLNVNPQDQVGRKLRLMINDAAAQFTSPLFEGADVKVAFE
jgi:molybdopterin converting factor small subunit